MLRRRLLSCLLMLAKRPRLLAAYSILLGSTVLAAPWIWAVYHLHQARKELTRYHSHDARRHLAAYLRWRPHDVSAHLMAARANRRLGDYAQAEQHLLQAQREQKKTSEDVILEWALHRAALGDLEQTEFYLLPQVQDDCEQAMLVCEALAEGYRRT